jgi:hypothetical protein
MLLAATAALAAQDTSRTIEVRDSGEIVRVGAYKPRQYLGDEGFSRGVVPNRRNAIRAFGRARTARARTSGSSSASAWSSPTSAAGRCAPAAPGFRGRRVKSLTVSPYGAGD